MHLVFRDLYKNADFIAKQPTSSVEKPSQTQAKPKPNPS